MIRKVSTPIVNTPNDKKTLPVGEDPTDIIIFDGNFNDGTGNISNNATTLDLSNADRDIKNVLNEYTQANGGDYKKTYNELVRQLKASSNNDEFVTTTINRILKAFDNQYDKNDNPTYSHYKSVASNNIDVLKEFLSTPDSEYVKHAICGPIHEFGMKLLNDAGYNACVISGDYLDKEDNKGYHYALLYKLGDKKYVLNNYGNNQKIDADNIVDATKKAMSSYNNKLLTFGNVSIQGSEKGETYLEYFPKDEALFGEKIDKNTNSNILKDNKNVKNFIDYVNGPIQYTSKKSMSIGAEKNYTSQLVGFSVKNESNGFTHSNQQKFDLTIGTKNTTSKYFDKAKDKAIDAKYQIQNNKFQFTNEVILSDLDLQKNERTKCYFGPSINALIKDNKELLASGKSTKIPETNRPVFYFDHILKSDIKTLSINSEFKKFYNINTNNNNLKITPWVGVGLNAYGTKVKSSLIEGEDKITDNIASGDGRLKAGIGAYAQYKTGNLNINANASINAIEDIALTNPSIQTFILKSGKLKEVSFGANYKNEKNNFYGNIDYARVNVPNVYNKNLLNSEIGVNTENFANSKINTSFYAGYNQNSANLDMSSMKENIEKEKKYYVGARAQKNTKFGSISAGVEYDKYIQGFKLGKNQGLSANVSLIYNF